MRLRAMATPFAITTGDRVSNLGCQEIKALRNTANGRAPSEKLANSEYIFGAVVSKTVATTATYPFQVLRTRLQNNVDRGHGLNRQTTMVSEARRLMQAEGLSAFYRGLAANLIRGLPATCVTFVVYENVTHYLA